MRHIYVVTAVQLDKEGNVLHRRAWCWYQHFGDAEQACLHNHGDMLEYYYAHLVIERSKPGGGGCGDLANREWWYRAVYDPTGSNGPIVHKCEKPAALARAVGFGLG